MKLYKILPIIAILTLSSCGSYDHQTHREVNDPTNGTGKWNWHQFHSN